MASKLKWKSKASEPGDGARAQQLRAVRLLDGGRAEEACSALEGALEQFPDDLGLLINLGEAQRRLGRLEPAASTLLRAVQLAPEVAEASFNLGVTLKQLGETEAALACVTRAADLAPDRFETQLQLAELLRRGGDAARAIGHYQAALALSPGSFETLVGLAMSLRAQNRYEGAIAMARRAIELRPDSPTGHHELGQAFVDMARFDAAIGSFRRALMLDEHYTDSHFGLGCALLEVGQLGQALQHFRRSLELEPSDRLVHSALVFMMGFDPATSAEELLAEGKRWSNLHAEPLTPASVSHANPPEPERRLRIGYLGATFRDHVLAFALDPLLRHHDRSQVEVVCYSSTPSADAVTERLHGLADVWREVGALDDAALAELIRADQVDVLIDINMHMEHSRLRALAYRPAPVQMTWLAYPGTTGLACVDYRISDGLLDPGSGDPNVYAERTLRLPGSFWCYDPLRSEPAVSALPALEQGHVTFGCLNAFWKLNRDTLAAWAAVMKAVPRSRLLVLAPSGLGSSFVTDTLSELGITSDRVECVPRQRRADYLQTYQRIDICLDTIPYNGHTTSLDAFWMGVPVVTLVGDRVVGRAGFAQATLLDLPQLIATDVEQLVARTSGLAGDLKSLAQLRSTLRQRLEASKLMDGVGFARDAEQAYRTAWHTWCAERSA
jgi:predicted O-linked N-acetylglucosamine transferase (SPINDLY family)